ncbi:PREDICTED: sterile alpha and TIR motif-containing protein 1-like [Priapulus caudatus]|uniref:ADP-ribosyl cyclase/cyclic ADP-ribose hydrolase n=1 Tax=Priapulus caudatus TaxID=37621 RepID=A0ABM1EZC4_PRICU|nr:PREDICTED: sterile alpha and TIR motif-containing protein 1-like [Priapulus caudatus]
MDEIHRLVRQAWNMPGVGRDLAYALCDVLRTSGALDTLIAHCSDPSSELRFQSARTLEQCLSTNNRDYVVETGLDGVVKVACMKGEPAMARVGTGILENLFKHSEETCTKVVRLGGLESILTQSRSNDLPTMRHCAAAFANLALYGGAENHQLMIKQNVPEWLFPLAFSKDDSTRYYACLAICSLGSNKEIEAAVKKSGTLELVEPFLTSHDPQEFARSDDAHTHGRSKDWLQLLVPSLTSSRVEARSLAAFHFAMEASIKKRQNRLEDFYEIGAIDALKRVASSPNKLASKYAGEALQIIGEEIPHKLSLQVPLWTTIDVLQWVKQIGFELFESEFTSCRVDGDLLLQLDDAMLESDICMSNGILRKRFLRELKTLKINADYSCVDPSGLDSWMLRLQTDLSQYSYSMLHQGVCMDMLPYLNDDHLRDDCGIGNGIHRLRIAGAIRNTLACFYCLLLKVHLQLRGFRVFIDVERLEVGKFDMNLLTSIRSSKNFILVLTTHALDRCLNDENCKDWVHKEVKAALECGCSIIPVHDNFEWPEAEHLPEDMRAVCHFNGIRWIHDYQEACVDKLERFLRGENAMTKSDSMAPMPPMHGAGAPKFPLPPPAIDENRSDSGGSSGSLVDEASLFRELAGSEVVRGDSAAPTKTNAMPRAPALLLPEPPRSRRVREKEGET